MIVIIVLSRLLLVLISLLFVDCNIFLSDDTCLITTTVP